MLSAVFIRVSKKSSFRKILFFHQSIWPEPSEPLELVYFQIRVGKCLSSASTLVQTSFSSLIHETISPFLMFDIKRTPIQSPYSTYQHLFILCYLLSIFHLADINMINVILKLLY